MINMRTGSVHTHTFTFIHTVIYSPRRGDTSQTHSQLVLCYIFGPFLPLCSCMSVISIFCLLILFKRVFMLKYRLVSSLFSCLISYFYSFGFVTKEVRRTLRGCALPFLRGMEPNAVPSGHAGA